MPSYLENSGESTSLWPNGSLRQWTGSFSRDKEASPGAAEKAMSPAVWCWCVTGALNSAVFFCISTLCHDVSIKYHLRT